MEPLSTVVGAIQALYGMEGVERQREANTFLLAFAESEAAWAVGTQLLLDASLQLPPETLFFAANMLHTKTRREWARIPAASKPALADVLLAALQDLQTGRRVFHSALFSKLCATYAVVLLSAPDECRARIEMLTAPATLARALAAGDRAQLLFMLTLTRCVCDEMADADLPFAARDAMEMHLAALSEHVPRAVATVVTACGGGVDTGASAPSSSVDLRAEAFQCLNAWIKTAGISLTAMYECDHVMLTTLLDALGAKSTYLSVCTEILSKVVTVAEYPRAIDQAPALRTVANGLLKTRAACESALVEDEDDVSHAITSVVATFCETYVEWVVAVDSPPEATALGEFMLLLGAHPRRQIASLTLEFWLLVQDEPVAERHAFFQRDAFSALLDVLLRQCTYPQDAHAMDELELDDLVAFRTGSQGVADAFLAIFSLQRVDVLAHLATRIADATASAFATDEWSSIEVSLFALSVLADDVKTQLARPASSIAIDALVAQILESVLSASAPHVLVVTAAAKLLGQFATWLNTKATATNHSNPNAVDIVAAVLRYLDAALGAPQSCANAARSFMQVATQCAARLAHMPPAYLVASIQHFSDAHMAIADRLFVVEGLVRAAVVTPQCAVILDAVLTDALARLDDALARHDDVNAATVVCNELHVLGKVVRFIDAPSDVAGGRAITVSAVQHIWPHLASIIAQFGAHEPVMDALFALYSWCLQSLCEDMASELGAIAHVIVRVFDAHRFVAPLTCAAVAVDVFGKRSGANASDDPAPDVLTSFRDLLSMLSRTAFTFFTTHALSDAPDVLRAFYELAYRFLLFCPAAVLTSSDFSVLIDLALACLGNQDRASTNAVLVFLTFLLSESRGRLERFHLQIDTAVLGSAAGVANINKNAPDAQLIKWIDGLVRALAATSPSILFDALGKLLFALLSTYGDVPAVQTALVDALTAKSDALGLAALALADRERVLALWLRFALAPTRQAERRFRGVCSDFAKICRKELTADALEAHEWDG